MHPHATFHVERPGCAPVLFGNRNLVLDIGPAATYAAMHVRGTSGRIVLVERNVRIAWQVSNDALIVVAWSFNPKDRTSFEKGVARAIRYIRKLCAQENALGTQ